MRHQLLRIQHYWQSAMNSRISVKRSSSIVSISGLCGGDEAVTLQAWGYRTTNASAKGTLV